jgi:hypothetical protein
MRMKRTPHPLCGSTGGNWVRTLSRYGSRRTRWGRVAGITALVAAGAPFRWYERLRWSRALAKVPVREPVFICGHWQSGHTLVQLLVACDPRFATLRLRHAVQPAACLTMQRVLRWFLRDRLPQTRFVDKMPHGLDAPQGDDLALGLLTGFSFYNAWYFPQYADAVFRDSVLMEGISPRQLADWQRQYDRLLRKLLLESGRERVVVRNAGNTARLPHLLAAFPDARFIYCHRNPYEVFSASLQRWERLTAAFALERGAIARDKLEELTLSWYEQLLRRYLADRSCVPAGRLVEVAYSDLQQRPLAAVEQIYAALHPGGFALARPHVEQMLSDHPWELAGDEPLSPEQRAVVGRRWGFAFREWGYPL